MKFLTHIILVFTLAIAYSQEFKTPQNLGASFIKSKNIKVENYYN